jgi:hypothetical protein
MPISVSQYIRKKHASKSVTARLLPDVGIDLIEEADPICAKEVCRCIAHQPAGLIKDCCIKTLSFDDLGPSAKFYPNHGYYQTPGDILVLNKRMLEDPVHGVSSEGLHVSTFEFILAHELGHGWDAAQGHNRVGKDFSLLPDWLDISGWSEKPIPGYKRMRIQEKGYPEKLGEWYYHPEAKFGRYYGKMNPWDDWADSFAYYVCDMKDKLPKEKIKYFDKKIAGYYDSTPYSLEMDQFMPVFAFTKSENDPNIQEAMHMYPEFTKALVRFFAVKEFDKAGEENGVVIPTLREYMHKYLDEDESVLRKHIGRTPTKEEGANKVLDDFLKKQQTMADVPTPKKPGMLQRMFQRGVKMSSEFTKAASHLKEIADALDNKGYHWRAADLRVFETQIRTAAVDPQETFSIELGASAHEVDSLHQFIEEFKPSSKDPYLEAIKAYEDYLKKRLPEIGGLYVQEIGPESEENKKKVNELKKIFVGAINSVDLIKRSFDKPVPGKYFKDPMAPTAEEIKKVVGDMDKILYNKFAETKLKKL